MEVAICARTVGTALLKQTRSPPWRTPSLGEPKVAKPRLPAAGDVAQESPEESGSRGAKRGGRRPLV